MLKLEKSERGHDVFQEVAQLAKERYAERQKKVWKLPLGKTKDGINLRDATAKILTSILRFKSIVDVWVAFDPTGHASTVWAVLSLGLKITKTHMDRLDAVLEASSILADQLAQYASIEKHYRDRVFDDSVYLQKTLVFAYTSILEYASEVARQTQLKLPGSVLASINALSEDPLQELLKTLQSKESDVSSLSTNTGKKRAMKSTIRSTL